MTTKWFGNDYIKTGPHAYFYEPANDHTGAHLAQFEAVVAKVKELAELKDAYCHPAVQLVCEGEGEKRRFIAFRFTSDHCYNVWNGPVCELGPSLGRGEFYPWGKAADFEFYFK